MEATVKVDIGWVIHYREEDFQGGYWPMTPKGPYSSLKKALAVKRAMMFQKSSLNGKTYKNDRVRAVKIKLRVEVG